MTAMPTLRYAVVAGEEYVEVEKLILVLRALGENRAASLIQSSLTSPPLSVREVRP